MTSPIPWIVEVTSPPDRDDVVAELWWGDEMFAELRYIDGRAHLEIYGRPAGPWEFPFDEFCAALAHARERLGPPVSEL